MPNPSEELVLNTSKSLSQRRCYMYEHNLWWETFL